MDGRGVSAGQSSPRSSPATKTHARCVEPRPTPASASPQKGPRQALKGASTSWGAAGAGGRGEVAGVTRTGVPAGALQAARSCGVCTQRGGLLPPRPSRARRAVTNVGDTAHEGPAGAAAGAVATETAARAASGARLEGGTHQRPQLTAAHLRPSSQRDATSDPLAQPEEPMNLQYTRYTRLGKILLVFAPQADHRARFT